MLQGIIRNTLRGRFASLIHHQIKAITSSKTLVEKKKQVYQNQVKVPKKKDAQTITPLSEKQKQERRQHFQSILVELGKNLLQYLNFKMGADPNTIEVTPILTRHQSKMLKKYNHLHALQLINYVQIVKNLALTKMEHIENIDTAYKELKAFIQTKEHQDVLQQHFRSLWTKADIPLQYQIRSVGLMEYMPTESRREYIHKIVPLIRYFKSTEIQILLFQKWRYNYEYPYELIDQIHRNQYYFSMEDINSSYWKMLFVESIKGQFIGHEDGIYSKILSLFKDKPNILAHAAFHKFVKILQSQGYYVQGEATRQHLENSLNMFINIAKNQNYSQNSMNLSQLVELYLGFEETNATGQTLLSEITFLSKTTNFQMNNYDLPLYKQLLVNVLKNIKPVLKYQRIDYLNKQYTYDSINFLNQFLPKYINLWPEVIFEVNDASYQLFSLNAKDNTLIQSFVSTFNNILQAKQSEIDIKNVDFTLKILRFLATHKKTQLFAIELSHFRKLLEDFLRLPKDAQIQNEILEVVYLTVSLLGQKCLDSTFKPLISKVNGEYIQYLMNRQLQNEYNGYIKSFNHKIVWLSLINAKIKSYGFVIDESIVQVFVNQRLFYMINSLKYLQVYELLVYVLSLSRLNYQIYSRLLSNLSTFIIYTNQKTTRRHGITSFFLNHRYIDYYYPICRLVLDNKDIFKKIQDKQSYKVLQIMLVKNLQQFDNKDILTFLEILGDPSFLNISLNKYIEDIKFTAAQLQNFQYSTTLRYFQYYNKSLLRFFEGKYNESEVKRRLKGGSLSSSEIEEFFSKIEVYKTIIMDGELNIRFELPQPRTNIPDFKYMYACQKIYQKIQAQNQFLLQEDEKQGALIEVNLQNEKDYINRQLLFLQDSENQFRIQNRLLPKYIKMQVWESNIFFDKRCIIDPKDLFLNTKKLTDQILNKIVKGVFGKYEKIREVVKEFSANDELITLLNEQRVRYQQHGAALQFKKETELQTSLTILCTNNNNYKILYICAYFIAKHGSRVIILKESDQVQGVFRMLKENFPLAQQDEQPEKQQEEEESEV